MDAKHIKLSIIGFAILLIGFVGVTYSFFNYTRTGTVNNLGTGRIYFNTNQGEALNLTNVFPMTSEEAEEATLDTVTVGISGDTTYADGEEFAISLVDVTNTVNNKEVPLNYIATYTAATGGSIGTSNSNYWDDRNDKNANIYLLNATGSIIEGQQVLVGYIKNGSSGISGTLSISAYIDADRVAISDTYYKNATSTPMPTAPTDEYGTTDEWVNGRTVLTTSEWHSLSTNPISFKIKAESNEGLWVRDPDALPTMDEMCPDCVFMYTTGGFWTTWNINSQTPTIIPTDVYEEDYEDVIASTGKNYFLGLKLNGNNQVEKAYSCGLYNGTIPFCLEGYSDGTKYEKNQELLQNKKLWNNTCQLYAEGTLQEYMYCEQSVSLVYVRIHSNGDTFVGRSCDVNGNGYVTCDGG